MGATTSAKSEPAGHPASRMTCSRVSSLTLGEIDGDGKDQTSHDERVNRAENGHLT